MKRERVCVAIFNWNKTKVLMVQHHEQGRTYFTLPGGGKEKDETDEQTGMREVAEETGLKVKIKQFLYTYESIDETVREITHVNKCYLGKKIGFKKAKLGFDPEEVNQKDKILIGIGWKSVKEMKDDIQIKEVIKILNLKV